MERSDDVWTFLNSREVGTTHALFYEEWALALESKGKMTSADEVYRLGINRKAQPLKRLQTSHQGHKNRAAGIEDDVPPQAQNQGRVALAARLPHGQLAPASLQAGQSMPSTAGRSVLGQSANGAKLDVFSDSQGAAPTDGLDQHNGEWADVGTRQGNKKENFIEAMPWKGEVLKQQKASVTPRIPKMSVFSDNVSNHEYNNQQW